MKTLSQHISEKLVLTNKSKIRPARLINEEDLSEAFKGEFKRLKEKFEDAEKYTRGLGGYFINSFASTEITKFFEVNMYIKYILIKMTLNRDTDKFDCILELDSHNATTEWRFELANKNTGCEAWIENVDKFVLPITKDAVTFANFLNDKLQHIM